MTPKNARNYDPKITPGNFPKDRKWKKNQPKITRQKKPQKWK